ncbi:MAG TPA: sugar phosphate isomerase/epimerase [Bacteroidia bacterium]|nr:sugar phosphate isomerase/epimerase [Bacteroidia bacterium]
MNRRHFLRTSILGSLAVPAIPAFALAPDNPYRKNIGIQLYTLRNQIKADLSGTIAAVAAAGYRQAEPYGFPDATALDLVKAARDNGMEVNSSHFAWESVTDPDKPGTAPFAEILGKAKDAGLSHLVIPYLHADTRKTADDYRRIAERCNAAAALAKEAGIQLAYHNHQFEFQPLEGGGTGFEVFAETFVPEMKFELDVFWVKVGGLDPVELLGRLKGRVSQVHLKDLKAGIALPEFGKLPEDAFKELGQGVIAMEPIIEVAAAAGVVHAHVEQDQSPDPLASIRTSIEYLKGL